MDKFYRPISYGFNSYTKTHTLQAHCADKVHNKHSIFLHSEIAALARLIRNQNRKPLRAEIILVIRFKKDGTLGNAFPCEICREAIKLCGIKQIYYSDDNKIKKFMTRQEIDNLQPGDKLINRKTNEILYVYGASKNSTHVSLKIRKKDTGKFKISEVPVDGFYVDKEKIEFWMNWEIA